MCKTSTPKMFMIKSIKKLSGEVYRVAVVAVIGLILIVLAFNFSFIELILIETKIKSRFASTAYCVPDPLGERLKLLCQTNARINQRVVKKIEADKYSPPIAGYLLPYISECMSQEVLYKTLKKYILSGNWYLINGVITTLYRKNIWLRFNNEQRLNIIGYLKEAQKKPLNYLNCDLREEITRLLEFLEKRRLIY